MCTLLENTGAERIFIPQFFCTKMLRCPLNYYIAQSPSS